VDLAQIAWRVQQIWRRYTPFRSIDLPVRSTRKENQENVTGYKVVHTSDEPVPFINYKELPENRVRRIIEIKDSTTNPKTGVIWNSYKIVDESTVWTAEQLFRFEPNPIFPKNISASITSLPDNGYFHFLIEDLPRFLQVLPYAPSVQTLISTQSRKYIYDTLLILGIAPIISSFPVKSRSVFLSEKNKGGIFTDCDLETLMRLKNSVLSGTILKDKKIFVFRTDKLSDDKAKMRGLTQQGEVIQEISKYGFEILDSSQLSFKEQIEVFSSATVIAGFHGAGLANQVWQPEGSRVIEFVGERRTAHFSHLASVCRHDYFEIDLESSWRKKLEDLMES
jgi:hypothetical protein